jgi:hypothetical protein
VFYFSHHLAIRLLSASELFDIFVKSEGKIYRNNAALSLLFFPSNINLSVKKKKTVQTFREKSHWKHQFQRFLASKLLVVLAIRMTDATS